MAVANGIYRGAPQQADIVKLGAHWQKDLEKNLKRFDIAIDDNGLDFVFVLQNVMKLGSETLIGNVKAALAPFAQYVSENLNYNVAPHVTVRSYAFSYSVAMLLLIRWKLASQRFDRRMLFAIFTVFDGVNASYNEIVQKYHAMIVREWDQWRKEQNAKFGSLGMLIGVAEMDRFADATKRGVRFKFATQVDTELMQCMPHLSVLQRDYWDRVASAVQRISRGEDDSNVKIVYERASRCMFLPTHAPTVCVCCLEWKQVRFTKNSHVVSSWYLEDLRNRECVRIERNQASSSTTAASMHAGKLLCDDCEQLLGSHEGELKTRDRNAMSQLVKLANDTYDPSFTALNIQDAEAFIGFVLINVFRIGIGESLRRASLECIETLQSLRRFTIFWCRFASACKDATKILKGVDLSARAALFNKLNANLTSLYLDCVTDDDESISVALTTLKTELQNRCSIFLYVIPEDYRTLMETAHWLAKIAVTYGIPFPVRGENVDDFGACLSGDDGVCIFGLQPLIVAVSRKELHHLKKWFVDIASTREFTLPFANEGERELVGSLLLYIWCSFGGSGFDGKFVRG
jgi:hypothetical protein